MRAVQSYLKYYFLFFIIGFLCLVTINLIIDPERIFRIVEIEGFNQEKPGLRKRGMRVLKSLELEQGNYDTLILGTSRSEWGLDPVSPAFSNHNVYNAGLIDSNLYEISKAFEFAFKNQKLKVVILGLDFVNFSRRVADVNESKSRGKADFDESRFAGKSVLEIYLKNIISQQALINSWETFNFNRQRIEEAKTLTESGLSKKKNKNRSHKQKFKTHLVWASKKFKDFTYDAAKLEFVRDIIKTCQDNTIELYLFISPTHAKHLEVIKNADKFSDFEQWKRDLTQTVADSIRQNHAKVKVWDFSGYNAITTEKVPVSNQATSMEWYVDPSHYNKPAGDLLLEIMLSHPRRRDDIPSDFGVIINSDNIESHLRKIRVEQARYHP